MNNKYAINTDSMPSIDIAESHAASEAEDFEVQEKETWSHRAEFFLSVMAYSIGLGNLLRFPYLCMKNGGGAFIIPYFVFLFLIGIPLYLLELIMGQYSGMTPIKLFSLIAPFFKGIGWTNALTCLIYNIYYNVVIGWVLFYLIHSFFVPLTWSSCNYVWNTEQCYLFNRSTTRPDVQLNCTEYNLFSADRQSVTAEFFEKYMLKISSGLHEWGSVRWELVLSLIAAWLLMFVCVCRGIHSFGKMVYAAVLLPYVMLTILLIRGVLLPGSGEGILFYLTPDWPRLATLDPWLESAQQIFWSLAPTWGCTIYLSSRNKFQYSIYRDALLLPIVCCLTSFFGGFVIFAYIGNMAWMLNTNVSCIFQFGAGLAFVIYPEAVLNLPLPQLWSLMFFTLLLMLGLGSAFSVFIALYQMLADEFELLRRRPWLTKLIMVAVSFAIGLPMTTNAAMYIFVLMDWYQVTLLMVVALIEVICFAYFYGTGTIRKNLESMTGTKLSYFWDFYWRGPILIILTALLIGTVAGLRRPSYGNYTFTYAAVVFGWSLAGFNICPLLIGAIVAIGQHVVLRNSRFDGLADAMKALFRPSEEWRLQINFNSEGFAK